MYTHSLKPQIKKTKAGSLRIEKINQDSSNCITQFEAGTTACLHNVSPDTYTHIRLLLGGYRFGHGRLGNFTNFRNGQKYLTVPAKGAEEVQHIITGLKHIVRTLEEQMSQNTLTCACRTDDVNKFEQEQRSHDANVAFQVRQQEISDEQDANDDNSIQELEEHEVTDELLGN